MHISIKGIDTPKIRNIFHSLSHKLNDIPSKHTIRQLGSTSTEIQQRRIVVVNRTTGLKVGLHVQVNLKVRAYDLL